MILSNIVIYEKNTSSDDFINKKIETEDKWNQINVLSMESMLVANFCMSLLHMSKSYIWIEETNQRINEFLLDVCRIQIYSQTKFLRSKWKHVLKTHLVQIPTNILIEHYIKNTRVLVLVVFYELGSTNPRKMF